MMKRNKDEGKLFAIVDKLMEGSPLPEKCKDHALTGQWAKRRDCHIEPNWLLIYRVKKDDLILERTGSHSDLYK